MSSINENNFFCLFKRRNKKCIFIVTFSFIIHEVKHFLRCLLIIYTFYWRSGSCLSYYIWLYCCVLDEGTLGLRSSYASLWPLPREKGTFQHLHECTIWVSSALFLFFTHLKKKKLWGWYFCYWFVRALYTPIIINPFVKILAIISPTSCHLISWFKKCSELYIFWCQII